MTKVGTLLIQAWLEVWKIRCTDRHGKDEAEQKTKCRDRVLAQLQELYALKHKVLPAHRFLFLDSAEAHLETTQVLESLEDWITAFRPAILSSVKKAQSITYLLHTTNSAVATPIPLLAKKARPSPGPGWGQTASCWLTNRLLFMIIQDRRPKQTVSAAIIGHPRPFFPKVRC